MAITNKNLNFKLSDNPVLEDNPEFKSIPELACLTERQLRYVMLVDWYQSPLRLLPPEERKMRAALLAGYKLEGDGKRLDINGRNIIAGKVESVEKARKVFSEIQYDYERELIIAIDNHIHNIIKFLNKKDKNAQELEKANNMMSKLPSILENRKKVVETLNYRDEQPLEIDQTQTTTTTLLDEFNTK